MNNKIIEVQEILFKEMKRLDKEDFLLDNNSSKEIARSTAIYNQATGFIKAVNTNINIMNMAKREGTRVENVIEKLGLEKWEDLA